APVNPGPFVHFHLGNCYQQMGKAEEAIKEYRKEPGYGQQFLVAYQMASAFNKLNQRDSCYKYLQASSDAGFYGFQNLTDDFSNLKNEQRFITIAEQIRKNEFPCMDDSVYRQFDFWVGDWNVYNKAGFKVGTSKIESILGKCVVLENWTDYF